MKLELLYCRPETPSFPGRPPLLFVHGSYCGAWVWAESFMPRLAAAGYSCQAVSLRGHGGSEGDLPFATLADYVGDVDRAIDHLGGRCVLIGHSMGGLVVQHCLARPGRVAAAVLMASVPPSGLAAISWYLGVSAPDLLARFGMLQSLGPEVVTDTMVRRAFFSPTTPLDRITPFLPRLQAESHRICLELMLPPPPPLAPLGQRPPVLVLGGDEDRLIPVFALHETARSFDADLEILAGAPHGLMLDPDWSAQTADLLRGWLAAHGI